MHPSLGRRWLLASFCALLISRTGEGPGRIENHDTTVGNVVSLPRYSFDAHYSGQGTRFTFEVPVRNLSGSDLPIRCSMLLRGENIVRSFAPKVIPPGRVIIVGGSTVTPSNFTTREAQDLEPFCEER